MGWLSKVRWRLSGVPRTVREIDRSLALLAQLRELGWSRSARLSLPFDGSGQPIPWLTYPALHWLSGYVQPGHTVFEFGAGHSTLWFAGRVKEVHSVEHDAGWADRLRTQLPANVSLTVAPARSESGDDVDGPYVRTIHRFADGFFDIVLIDGMERCGCARGCIPKLRVDGVIIFDNSDRPSYRPGLQHLVESGFSRVDFVGFVPGYWHLACTSVLFRPPGPFNRIGTPPFLGR